MKIKIIVPAATDEFNAGIKKEVDTVKAPDCSISIENLKSGPQSIESRYDEFLAGPDIVKISLNAQQQGFDGIFIDCFGEPQVSVVREIVDIPVIGGFGAALMTANMISQKFSIISVLDRVVAMNSDLVRTYGLGQNIASMPIIGMEVKELKNKKKLIERLVEVSLNAIKEQGAQAIVLGCTGMLDVAKSVEKILKDKGKPAPVIDPTTTAIGFLQSLIRNNLSQSRLTYFTPEDFPITPSRTKTPGIGQ
ncbi:MAG: racemase [Desulfobacteraceae bacterium]|nr:racemase [Desulfobacteraceae bacterium]